MSPSNATIMRFVVETDPASHAAYLQWPAWRLVGVRVAVPGGRFPDAEAARDAAGRVRQQACTAIGS